MGKGIAITITLAIVDDVTSVDELLLLVTFAGEEGVSETSFEVPATSVEFIYLLPSIFSTTKQVNKRGDDFREIMGFGDSKMPRFDLGAAKPCSKSP